MGINNMPYIKSHNDRRILKSMIHFYMNWLYPDGHLNFFLCALFGMLAAKQNRMSYKLAKEFIGELECAKLEIYRRYVAPYEDIKIQENGDLDENR